MPATDMQDDVRERACRDPIEPDLTLAGELFDTLRALSFDGVGITRDTYGAGEQRAHDLMRDTAQRLGLEVTTDAALNLYMTLPGRDRTLPAVMTGSHLDSVPRGGNFDGAAGVVAGLAALAGWLKAGWHPEADVTVMGIRAEESAWFPVSYIGSKAAFGLLPPETLNVPRLNSDRPLIDFLTDNGADIDALRAGRRHLDPARIDCFVELHIEQGPVLVEAGDQVGVVTGICGSLRYRDGRVFGQYAHSGATPSTHRRDAVVGMAALICQLQQDWATMEAEGHELNLTFGRMFTDHAQADFSKVSGRVDFTIDVRSRFPATLNVMDSYIHAARDLVEAQWGVRVELGQVSGSTAAAMDEGLRKILFDTAHARGLRVREMPSGAGHDSATFANLGVPTAMLFIRNAHGSHNPDEAMDMADFADGARLVSALLATRASGALPETRASV
jgi:N-carbamoyl-L-amino-acid hydrolase